MSTATSTIGIKLTLDGARQIESGLRGVTSGIDTLGRTAAGVRSALGQLAGTFAGVVSVQQFARAADAVTQLQNSLRLATGSADLASQAYGRLFEIAQRSRVSFVELGGTFASVARAGDSLKLSQTDLLNLTETIGNAVTVSGASAQASQAALIQLSQGLASGVLRGEELNSVMEQTPRLARALADGLGVPLGALRELGKEGQLSAERVVNALLSQSAVLAGEVRQSVITVGQAMTQLQNASTVLAGEIDRTTGASALLATTISDAAKSLSDIAGAFRQAESAGKPFAVFGDSIATVFETVTVLGANVAYVIKGIGTEIGGLAAQAAAAARLDFSGAAEIGRLMKADAEKARADVDALSSRILNARRLSQIAASGEGMDEPRFQRLLQGSPVPAGGLDLSGKPKKPKSDGGLSRALLSSDVSDVKAELKEYTAAYQSALDLVEARRAAGLISEREFYEAQRGFIGLNSDAQLRALDQEKTRLEAEKSTGAERVRQMSRIREIDREMAAVRADSASQLEKLVITEEDRLKRVELAYQEAKAAADDYLASLERGYAREKDGIGRGDRARRLAGGLNQIDDRYASQRQSLANDRLRGDIKDEAEYQRRLDLINKYNELARAAYSKHYADIEREQGKWMNGASEAIANYAETASNVAGLTNEAFTNAFQGMEDALVTFVTTGKLSFTDLANSIVADITRIIIKQQISNALGVAGGSGGSGALGLIGAGVSALFGTSGTAALASSMPGNSLDTFLKLNNNFGTGPSFDGGGYTGDAPRVGGVDGKGGFWALMHPQETVVDHARGQTAGMTVTNHFTISGPVDRRTEGQIAAAAHRGLTRWQRNL